MFPASFLPYLNPQATVIMHIAHDDDEVVLVPGGVGVFVPFQSRPCEVCLRTELVLDSAGSLLLLLLLCTYIVLGYVT